MTGVQTCALPISTLAALAALLWLQIADGVVREIAFAVMVIGGVSTLLVNGNPANGLSGGGASYTFNVAQPAAGTLNITWATNHSIIDTAAPPNSFVGTGTNAAWSFTLDTRVVLVQSNSNWRLFKGLAEASAPASAWRQPGFDDSSWSNSPAPFFFGEIGRAHV